MGHPPSAHHRPKGHGRSGPLPLPHVQDRGTDVARPEVAMTPAAPLLAGTRRAPTAPTAGTGG